MSDKIYTEDWIESKLGEIVYTTSGGTPSRRNKTYYNGTIPWVKSGELDKGLIKDTEEKITEEAIQNSSAKIFPEGTLLIALYGATIGKLAFLGVEAATNQAICGIFENEYVNSKYLYNFLLYSRPKLIGKGTGGAQPNISQTILRNLDIPFSPLPIQQAIVKKIEELFSSLDNGIADLKKAKEKLSVYRLAILEQAFEGELTKDWRKENPENKWSTVKLKDVLKLSREKHQPDTGKKHFHVGLKDIEKDTGKLLESAISEEIKSTKNIFKPGQILYGKLRPYLNKVHLATTSGVCSTDILVFNVDEKILGKFALYFMLSSRFVNDMSSNTSGVNLPRVPNKYINNYKIHLPPLSEQHQIVKEIESRLSVCDAVEKNIEESLLKAESLRQSILKKAFEGKLLTDKEVEQCKQHPDYEPASVLLERIKEEQKSKNKKR